MDLLKEFKGKIIAIVVLIILIVIGLFVLNLRGCASSKPKPTPTPTPTAEPTPAPTPETTPEPTPETTPEPEVDLTSDDSITRYISQKYPVSETYVPADLRTVNVHVSKPQQLRAEAADKLEELFQAAIDDKIYLKLASGYRSYREQADLHSYYTQTRGAYYASIVDDHPGASEHQLGLAADLGCWNGACELSYCFTSYPNYKWLQENSWKYGWIERYPEGTQSITGMAYSPWHYRYLGLEEAKKVHESGLTMEEYYKIS